MMVQPAHYAHMMASASSSPFQEPRPSSPVSQSPASDGPRYFSEREYDSGSDAKYSYSSPPSSVPSSANTSYQGSSGMSHSQYGHVQHPFHSFTQDYSHEQGGMSAPNYGYNSSPMGPSSSMDSSPSSYQHPAPHMQEQYPPQYSPYSQYPSYPAHQVAPQHQIAVHPAHHIQEPPQNMPYPNENVFLRPSQAPRAAMIPGLNMDRPEPKRRKTCPEILSSPTMQKRRINQSSPDKEKRGAGKDGEDVWPEDVEIAFFESIRLVPKLGRKKIPVNGKPCGRNELIGDYIRRKTGKLRSRKQVSSHIQVLKNIRRNDVEFINLVAEPKPGEGEEDFTPEASALFFAPQEYAHVQAEAHTPSASSLSTPSSHPLCAEGSNNSLLASSAGSMRDGLLSPYCGKSFFSHSSSSGASSPALSACSGRSVSPYAFNSFPVGGTNELPAPLQNFQLKLAPPSPALQTPLTAPVEIMAVQEVGSAVSSAPSGPVTAPTSAHPIDANATPKCTPSKLGHRRAASRGLSLTIPPIKFIPAATSSASPEVNATATNPTPVDSSELSIPGKIDESLSNPSTPWPQVLHTPTCPPAAPNMLASPSQRQRLSAIWANSSADWNKASPALDGSFHYEMSAAVASSKNMQDAAARNTVPMKRSMTDIPLSSNKKEYKYNSALDLGARKDEGDDSFFSSLLGSRDY